MNVRYSMYIAALLSLLGLHNFANASTQPSALEVMQWADQVEDGDTATAQLLMMLIDKKNKKTVRKFSWWRKDQQEDSKSRIMFHSPADLEGTGFIGWNWQQADRDDDTWLCLPALQKCKRISNDGQAGSFLGTDFSFYDMNGLNIGDWNYQFLEQEESYAHFDSWVIEATASPEKKQLMLQKTGYQKLHLWVDKRTHLIVKAKFWLEEGGKQKVFFAKDIQQIDGIWTITQQQMISYKRGVQEHATVIHIQDITYNQAQADSDFTTEGFQLAW